MDSLGTARETILFNAVIQPFMMHCFNHSLRSLHSLANSLIHSSLVSRSEAEEAQRSSAAAGRELP